MCFDVPKIVRSPECDHRHDKESRNDRYIKIDILDGYIRTPEVFRVISEKTGVREGLSEPPGEALGLSGPEGRERATAQEVARPLPWGVRIGQGGGGGAPSFLTLSLSFLSPSSFLVGLGNGSPTPTRRRTPPSPWRVPRPAGPPPCSFIYGGRGHPRTHKLIVSSRVRCPPPP